MPILCVVLVYPSRSDVTRTIYGWKLPGTVTRSPFLYATGGHGSGRFDPGPRFEL